MRRFLPPLVLLIASAGALSGCARTDTYNRPYTWHPSGATRANIAAQVVHPEDLVVGRGSDETDAAALVPGIERVDAGQAPPASASTGSGASGAGTGAGASGAGGGASASGG